jgi:hypothetical protein
MKIFEREQVQSFRQIDSYRLSCKSSSSYSYEGNYAGVVVWQTCPTLESLKVRDGYILIKDTDDKGLPDSNEGQVHGKVVKSLAGVEPSKLIREGAVLGGFAIRQFGQVEINSGALNTKAPDGVGRSSRELTPFEEFYVQKVVRMWMDGKPPGFTCTPRELEGGENPAGWNARWTRVRNVTSNLNQLVGVIEGMARECERISQPQRETVLSLREELLAVEAQIAASQTPPLRFQGE